MTVKAVKAVFYVEEVTDTANGAGRIKARPAAKGPYADYSQYTPTGSLEFTSLNPAATTFFREHLGSDVVLECRTPTEADLITPPFKG